MKNPSTLFPVESASKKLSIGELLDVANLKREEIEERVKNIQEKIDCGEVISQREQEKFDKIKFKLEIGGVDSFENLKKLIRKAGDSRPTALSGFYDQELLNVKYINQEFLTKIAHRLAEIHDLSKDEMPKAKLDYQIFQPDRQSDIKDIDKEVERGIMYFNDYDKFWVVSHNSFGNFNFNVKVKDNKCIIEFDVVEPNSANSLYPEEIQIKLLKALTNKYPELKEKLSSISELTLQHNVILNKDTLNAMILYMGNSEEKYDDSVSVDSQKVNFPKTPNGNNMMNFIREFAKNFCSTKDIKFDKGKAKINIDNHRLSISFKFLTASPQIEVSEPLASKLEVQVNIGPKK